jgi:hypothetical protein
MPETTTFISLDDFIARVKSQQLYTGYIVDVGYAYIKPVFVPPSSTQTPPFYQTPFNRGATTVIWLQEIDTSAKARMESLGQDTEKWTDFWGSTTLQRFAADSFASQNNGTVKRRNNVDIHVEYVQKIGILGDTDYPRTQYFRKDGTLIPQEGEIRQLGRFSFSAFEMWADSPSDNYGQVVQKIVLSIGYSIINSPKILLTGRSWSGHPANSNEKMEAFIDVGPGMLLKGLTATNSITKVGKNLNRGLDRYNDFLRKNPIYKGNQGLPPGTSWQINAGRAYQVNQQNVIMIDNVEDILDALGRSVETYEKSSNMSQ